MTPTPDALLKAYSEHAAEYRMEVQMGWSRLQFFLALNLALLIASPCLGGKGIGAAVLYLAGALASLLGVHAVRTTHRYYSNAKAAFQAVERELGLASFGIMTTVRMRRTSWLHSPRITTAGVIVLLVFVAFDIALAVLALWSPT